MSLLIEEKHRVLTVTLNRPEKRNALNAKLCRELVNAVNSAQNNANIGAILLSAYGNVFCAGMDLNEASQVDSAELARIHNDVFSIGMTSKKPIVVCVSGAALGGGLGLAAQGHVVIASDNAVFGLTEIRVGLWPLMVYRSVEAALGARRTLELSLTGRLFHSPDALQWGLVHQTCTTPEVAERARAVSKEIAKACPTAIAVGMDYVRRSRGRSWEEVGQLAGTARVNLMNSEDFREGCRAFLEKREPHWPSIPADFYSDQANHNSDR